jgi:tetratricopeptide (TPR) repeat protein
MPAAASNAQADRNARALFDAALDVAPDARAAWLAERCAGDAALLARVRALLSVDAAGSVLGSGTVADGVAASGASLRPPAQVGPYRLEELIGSGGMGAVYRASRNDGLFEQTVAIKFVRPVGGRVPVEALIDAERRLLARMQHPGIARILDGGCTAEGLHYLVMEFVQGLPIDEHAQRHALGARQRVRLLREVCDAVADAHRHLVLHCDLKPANVLVDASGAPKLIDFGIARLRDVIDPALPHGFTRNYASPQRLAGEPPTVADDVYALGVLLVELLTGQLPQGAAALAPAGALDAELAAIARQALADAPQARYASVDAFAADLQRWLDRLPVAALPGHWRYRARKLVQRHPWRAAAAALSLGTLVVALAVIATLYARADAARHDAEQRFGEVRSLANYMLFDLDARLEATPGTTAIRRGLVERSQQYLDTLARTAGDHPELQREVAVGLGRLAEIQGGWAIPNLGERAAARPTFERAEAMLTALLQRRPDEWAWRRDLGRVQQRLADFYGGVDNDSRKQLAKAREAEGQLQRALDAAVAAKASARDQAELHTLLSSARLAQAFAMDWIDESPAAIALASAEEARLLALPETLRREMDFGYRAGRAAGQLGDSLFFLDRFEESLAAYRRAQQRYAQALERAPNDRRLLDGSAVSRWAASLAASELGRHAEALADSDTGIALVGRLIALDPGNDNAQRLMLILRSDRSMVLGRLARHDEAIALAEEVLRERRARAMRAPEISEPARDAVVPLHALAELYWRKGDTTAACAASRNAIAAWADYEKRWGLTELDRKQNAEKERQAAQRCSR